MDQIDIPERSDSLTEFPTFELDYLVDKVENPTVVMIVPNWDDNSGITEWITMDINRAVSVEEIL